MLPLSKSGMTDAASVMHLRREQAFARSQFLRRPKFSKGFKETGKWNIDKTDGSKFQMYLLNDN